MKLTINKEFQFLMWSLTDTEYTLLEDSIVKEGCRDPIVVTGSVIVDGHNRYNICQKHNITFTTSSMVFPSVEATKEWIDLNQIGKRNLTDDQARIVRGRAYNRIKKNVGKPKCGQIGHIRTVEKVAKDFGVSENTIKRDAKFAIEVADSKELQEAVRNKVPIRQLQKQQKIEKRKKEYAERIKVSKQNPRENNGPFELILADPPWKYDFSATENREIENQYETATLDTIINHKPNSAENSILLLWATAPKLLEALEVMKAWGFEYKTHAVWDKEVIGMGYWFRGQHELLLVGTKGNPGCTPNSERMRSIIREKRTVHSRKPSAVYEWIEKAFPDKIKLEMYCRNPRKGWSVWGNEI